MVGTKISTLMYNHALGGSLFTTAMRECTEIIFVTLLVGDRADHYSPSCIPNFYLRLIIDWRYTCLWAYFSIVVWGFAFGMSLHFFESTQPRAFFMQILWPDLQVYRCTTWRPVRTYATSTWSFGTEGADSIVSQWFCAGSDVRVITECFRK